MTTHNDAQSVIDILDELIDIVRNARSVPMSASAMVNRSQVLDLLVTARDILPEQIVEADGLLAKASDVTTRAHDEADVIRERAERDAEDTLAAAREQASRLVSQDSVTVAARAQAQRILDEAAVHSDRLKDGADKYSDTSLRGLQDQVADLGNSLDDMSRTVQDTIDNLLAQIQAGRNVIARRRAESDGRFESSSAEGAPSGEDAVYEEDEPWT